MRSLLQAPKLKTEDGGNAIGKADKCRDQHIVQISQDRIGCNAVLSYQPEHDHVGHKEEMLMATWLTSWEMPVPQTLPNRRSICRSGLAKADLMLAARIEVEPHRQTARSPARWKALHP